jgi:hypothetical protein
VGEAGFAAQPTIVHEESPSGLEVFRRVGEAGFAAQPTTEHGESPETFLISARDPLPLRLCTFAPLRSFLPAAGSLREIH